MITVAEYEARISQYSHVLDKIEQIVASCGEVFEGNCMYHHLTFNKFSELAAKQTNIANIASMGTNILEVGFNAGHSTLLFLIFNPACKMYCFDICEHKYTKLCLEYIETLFPGRINFYEGSSSDTLPLFLTNNPLKMDIIHIDGCHAFHIANTDFFHCKNLARKGTILIWDDTDFDHMSWLLDHYIQDKHVEEFKLLNTNHGLCRFL